MWVVEGSKPRPDQHAESLNNLGKSAAYVMTSANDQTRWSSRIRTINRRFRLTTPSTFRTLWDVKEPTHYLQRVGPGVSGVMVCSLSEIMVWGNKCSETLPTPTYTLKNPRVNKADTFLLCQSHPTCPRLTRVLSKGIINDIWIQLRDFNH